MLPPLYASSVSQFECDQFSDLRGSGVHRSERDAGISGAQSQLASGGGEEVS